MRSGFKIARVFGINIYVDWSWILIFLLVTWNLAAGVFPPLHSDWGPALDIGMGILASLLFFLSVLLHELAHSVVAKARGLPVRRIVLFFFGGVSNIEREPPSAKTEFLMAIVGPLTSIVLGLIFLFIGARSVPRAASAVVNPLAFIRGLDPFSTMLLWLGPINILVGLFNLVPGFPLDGGRVLRSILWAISHNFRRATRWATAIGQGFGWLMILCGIAMVFGATIPVLGSGFVNGLWLAFIGWFLINAAAQSYQQVLIEDMLEGVPVDRLMRKPAAAISPDTPVSTLIFDHIMQGEDRAFPVEEGGRLVGMVYADSLRELDRHRWDRTPVREVMVPASQLDAVTPREDAMEAFQKLVSKEARQLPVVQNGELVGVLRRRDVLNWLKLRSEVFGG
jgi:Zn-dependent protease